MMLTPMGKRTRRVMFMVMCASERLRRGVESRVHGVSLQSDLAELASDACLRNIFSWHSNRHNSYDIGIAVMIHEWGQAALVIVGCPRSGW